MVLNLKDKEGNLSGKGFNWSLFGLLDGQKESNNSDVFKRIAEDMIHTKDAGESLGKEFLNLTKSGQEFAQELVHSKKPIEETKKAFLDASTNANKMSIPSKAAAVGMNILNAAMNMGIMLAITGLIQLAVKGFDALTVTFEEQQEKVDGLKQKFEECTSKIETLTSQLEENRKKIAEINANPLSIVDSTTLTTLQSENAELERQIELNKQITKDTNKQLGVETSKLLEKESQKSETKKTTLEESTVLVFSQNNVLRPHMWVICGRKWITRVYCACDVFLLQQLL